MTGSIDKYDPERLAAIAQKWCPDAPIRCVSAIEEALELSATRDTTEPVAWMWETPTNRGLTWTHCAPPDAEKATITPLYTRSSTRESFYCRKPGYCDVQCSDCQGDAPTAPHARGALIERVAKALCQRAYPARTLDEAISPSRQLWMRLIPEAEIAVQAMESAPSATVPTDILDTARYWSDRSHAQCGQGSVMDLYKLANWIVRSVDSLTKEKP